MGLLGLPVVPELPEWQGRNLEFLFNKCPQTEMTSMKAFRGIKGVRGVRQSRKVLLQKVTLTATWAGWLPIGQESQDLTTCTLDKLVNNIMIASITIVAQS